MPEPKSSLKLKLFEALSEAYPDGTVAITDYPPGHSKLAARRLIHAHMGVRVKFENYAIAGMVPATASETDIGELVARLADDKRRTEEALIPGVPG